MVIVSGVTLETDGQGLDEPVLGAVAGDIGVGHAFQETHFVLNPCS
jgi:hypothetical protein